MKLFIKIVLCLLVNNDQIKDVVTKNDVYNIWDNWHKVEIPFISLENWEDYLYELYNIGNSPKKGFYKQHSLLK